MRALVALVLAPALAHADAPRDIQECESSRSLSYEDATTCGTYYTDLYAKNPSSPQHDATLFNAGVMFENGKAFTAALNAYAQLRRQYPKSKIASKALARSAKLYGELVMYDRAAELLEEYATKYAGEKDAYDAMSDAVYYRRALGHDDKAIANTKYFVKTFGSKKPQDAANADFSLIAIYERQGKPDATFKHLQEYVRMWGTKGGTDRLVIANAKLGQLAWDATCPVRPIDGACVKVKRMKGVCRNDVRFELVKRKDTKKALAYFASAIKLYEKHGGTVGGDEAGARYYYARSLLARADQEAEVMLAPAVPAPVKLEAWGKDDLVRRQRLASRYLTVTAVKDPATSVVATARVARMFDVLVTALANSPTKKADCDAAASEAQRFAEITARAYDECLETAARLGWYSDDGSGACEAALARLDPERVPPIREMRATATNTATVTATELLPPTRP